MTLLLFRLYKISPDAYWSGNHIAPLPDGCAALAVSGGMSDFHERMRMWDGWTSGRVPPIPFLHDAPGWLLPRIAWSLSGASGRLYPIYRTDRNTLQRHGFEHLPASKFSILVSLKLKSMEAAESAQWVSDFLTCWSHGLALGFAGDRGKLERRMMKALDLTVLRPVGAGVYTAKDLAAQFEEAQPYLWACWQSHGFQWLLENSQMVIRPWGWEGSDAIIIVPHMSHDDAVRDMRRRLDGECEILEFDGDDAYWRWASKRTLDI